MAAARGRLQPANSVIPQSDITPFAAFILNDLPLPNSAVNPNLFENLRKDHNDTDKLDAKIDGQITPGCRL